ncbi:AraC family transcriptional regulator [Mesorhizobium sp.]|uniref:AraC family transcriptional regulator n=1 Tax=Mesorhizobium sp. TaxID=1871066 RepID=UPI000FE5BD65|nr:AraC family transcriptional regulator [Mesorhizobium sp.]RWC58206.1 MAG: AraC family transcriptional regulator [Mesorhizobium sp.]RWC59847.1 MAG: AraC family transcriptional regulator [Mesorhizobium sp.]
MNARNAKEHTRYFTAPTTGIECLTASFCQHHYAPHAHDTYVIGALLSGKAGVFIRGAQRFAGAGDLTLYNPHDVHDGVPMMDGYSYRVSYPEADLIVEIASEMADSGILGTPSFPEPVVKDLPGSALFFEAHRAWEDSHCPLEAEELMLRSYRHCLSRHARIALKRAGAEEGPVARAAAVMSERFDEKLTLAELVREARLPRQRLIEAFHRDTGFTPHAYLINRRVDAAKAMLRRGHDPVDVAAASGFADQAHLIRIFKARIGVTPGAYQAAFAM